MNVHGHGMADGGEVAPGAPKPTHINMHIHQESTEQVLPTPSPSPPAPGTISQTQGSRRLLVAP